MLNIIYFWFPLLLFIPGTFIIYLVSSKYKLKLSKLDILVLGSTFWSFLLISGGYVIGILSHLMIEFFLIFTILSMSLLICAGYYLFRQKNHVFICLKINYDNLILVSFIPFLILIFTLILTHSIFIEYDAIFLYLPLAKSIVATGGLHFSLYHQTNLITAQSPAMPIIYAWLSYLCGNRLNFDLAVRIIPFVYIMLTCILIYLISKEISNNSTIATIAALSFLFLPATSTIASNYSLYLDVLFTFLLALSLYILLKIFSKQEDTKFWWIMMGVIMSYMLLEKDVFALILPALIAILLVPALQPFDKKHRVLLGLMISILFTSAYNFFFVLDLYHFPADMMMGFLFRHFPIFIILIIFLLMIFMLPENEYKVIKKRFFLMFSLPFIPAIIYFLRNLFSCEALSPNLFLFNADFEAAVALMNQATGVIKETPIGFYETLRWDILFTSFNLGAIVLIPTILGLFAIIYRFISRQVDSLKPFILLSFFLMLLGLWSWTFRCSYEGPESRRLYYFAPLFAIFTAIGIQTIIEHTKSRNIVPRFIIFNSLVFIYLWAFKFNVRSLNTTQLGSTLVSLKIADVETLVVFAFCFLFSFYPSNIDVQKINIKKYIKKFLHGVQLIIPLALIALVLSIILPFSFLMLFNPQENITYVPPHWENDLYEVLSYINRDMRDNFTIITCYALPIAYFTSHPVIEVTRYEGVITLLQLNESSSEIINSLRERKIFYLLFPKLGHSHYTYFENLSGNLPILSEEFLVETPYILLLKEFSKFKLYRVITPEEAQRAYSYLTRFEKGWNPLNNYSNILSLPRGIAVRSSVKYVQTIADDYQDAFWGVRKADSQDEIMLSNDYQVKLSGNNSLKISINGTNNVVIYHMYETAQDWKQFSNLNIFLYGANTNKPIVFTFHTMPWHDYYYIYVDDDFIGWKKFTIPLNSFGLHGKPSWDNITYIEILLGGRLAIYYVDQISLEGYNIGLEGSIPPILTNSSQLKMVLSIKNFNLQFPVKLVITSPYGQLTKTLDDIINLITVPAELLKSGARLVIYYPQSDTEQQLNLYYLVILSD